MSEPRAEVEAWVAAFGRSLQQRDSAAVAALCQRGRLIRAGVQGDLRAVDLHLTAEGHAVRPERCSEGNVAHGTDKGDAREQRRSHATGRLDAL